MHPRRAKPQTLAGKRPRSHSFQQPSVEVTQERLSIELPAAARSCLWRLFGSDYARSGSLKAFWGYFCIGGNPTGTQKSVNLSLKKLDE
jgi:hypothetical protein